MASEAAGQSQEAAKVKVFISYSRKDMAFADRLDTALQGRNFEPLIDRSEIYAFEDWWARVQSLIAQADTIIFVLSPEAVASTVCAKEVAFAASLNKRFAPVVLRRVDDKLVPEALARLNFIFFEDDAQFEASFNQLCDALQTNIDWIRKHTDYGEAARRWAQAGRPGGLLLRSPVLDEAEGWIASRPPGAPAPTETTQTFIAASRRGATRRRNILTGSLAAGLIIALGLAGFAEQQRRRAEDTLTLATQTANDLVYDLARKFRNVVGVPAATTEDILARALKLQEQLLQSGQSSTELQRSEAGALDDTAKTLLIVGKSASALADAEKARDIYAALLKQQPDSRLDQDNLATTYDDIGDAQKTQGNLPEALKSYQASLDLRQPLAKSDLANDRWQHGLATSHVKIGDVQTAQGNLPEALKSFQASLAILQRLAKSQPGDTQWQRDLFVVDVKIGGVLEAQGNLPEALKSDQAGLAIMQGLAKAEPDNAQWQEDLGSSNERVGDVEVAQGNLAAALISFETKRDIVSRLAQSDPGNSEWQRDLAVANEKVGDVEKAQQNLTAAQQSYQAFLATMQHLTQTDPNNSQWQEDLSISNERLGTLSILQGNLPEALKFYQTALAIMQGLAKSDQGNAQWQRELATSYERVGTALVGQGDFSGALKSFQASFAILQRLAKPDDAGSQRNLAVAYRDLGVVYEEMNDWTNAQQVLSKGRAIIAALVAQRPDEAQWKSDLAWFDQLIAALKSSQASQKPSQTQPDPGNAGSQSDPFATDIKAGDTQLAQGNLAAALKSYQAALAIMQGLTKSDPGNETWLHDLAGTYEKLGDVQLAQENLPAALATCQAALAIFERLAQKDPANADWQADFALAYGKLAIVYEKMGDNANARQALSKGRAILASLVANSPSQQWKEDLAWFDQQIAALGK